MTDEKPEIDPRIISSPLTQENEDVVIIKRKKGRPRKEVVENVPAVPEEKKKRGRKKKEVVVEEIKKKKKRGRKAAVKYFSSSIRKKIPLTTVLQDKNNYILHLDVKDEDVTEEKISSIDNVNQQSNCGTLINPSVQQGTFNSSKEEFDVQNKVQQGTFTDDTNKIEVEDLVFEKLKSENKENIMELQK